MHKQKENNNNKVNMATLGKNDGGGDGNGWWFQIQLKNVVRRYNVRTV